ncbi:helix-turn-helix domain-containing protein [Anaeromicropila populeti]|uniref:AraC-type DNA-binding protein n=1 Tax=Anaeromicropila populeti TaxID=37658 RepID=A0A1I6IDX3_9FIRM|nr:helix-turn-helix domain-containing protein [Anaeromicropila populeti]SFR64883.1 AraC-type DNA-binding protein [Anaeromicropila populeti]
MSEWETRAVVQRMQEYIELHLVNPITLKQLADFAGYSPWYVSRMFKEITGKAPYEYIRSRRLTQAALVLREGNKKVVDVALDFIFDSQEGFTRAFSKEFGITPGKYRMKTPPIKLFLPEKVYDTYRAIHKKERMESGMKSVFVQIMERQKENA